MTDLSRYVVDYWVNGASLYQDDHAQTPPTIGHGIEYSNQFYRIVDVWTVHSKRGPVEHGNIAFLEKIDVPQVFHDADPDYYR